MFQEILKKANFEQVHDNNNINTNQNGCKRFVKKIHVVFATDWPIRHETFCKPKRITKTFIIDKNTTLLELYQYIQHYTFKITFKNAKYFDFANFKIEFVSEYCIFNVNTWKQRLNYKIKNSQTTTAHGTIVITASIIL